MEPLGHHLVFRARNSRILAPDVGTQRQLTRTLLSIGESFELLAFRAAGDHLHVELLADRARSGRFAQAAGSALTQVLDGPGFGPVWFEPMFDQRHVERTFAYIHANTTKHGVANDPLHEASSIGALLGLVPDAGGITTRVRRHLPRTTREHLLAALAIEDIQPTVRLDILTDAAAGAVLLPTLDESAPGYRARSAAARCALTQFTPAAVAQTLGCTERAVRRMRSRPADAALERAIQLRIGLRTALGARGDPDSPFRMDTQRTASLRA